MKQISNENCEKWSTIHFYSEQQLCGRKPSKPCVNILRRVDALMRWKPIVGKSHETQGINQHNRHRCRAMPVNKRIHRIFIIYWTRENAKKSHRQTHAPGGAGVWRRPCKFMYYHHSPHEIFRYKNAPKMRIQT